MKVEVFRNEEDEWIARVVDDPSVQGTGQTLWESLLSLHFILKEQRKAPGVYEVIVLADGEPTSKNPTHLPAWKLDDGHRRRIFF